MFLFWLLIAVLIGIVESAKDSYDAAKFKKSGGMAAKYPELFGKKK